MMILTMKPPDTPTTSTNGHNHAALDKDYGPIRSVGTTNSSIRSTSGSCNSLTSTCSNTTSCTMNSTTLKVKKRVSFSLKQTAYFSPQQLLSKEERKSECWYSEAELNISRDEARMAIQVMHHQLQLDAIAVAKTTTMHTTKTVADSAPLSAEIGSWVLRCPEDNSKVVCLRGIEKYADAAAKYSGQKRLVNSVLQQQSLNKEDFHVSMVSQTLSQPFKDIARYYAMKSAEELVLSRKIEEQEERDQRQKEEVATVLLLIMRQENNRKQQEQELSQPNTSSQQSSAKFQKDSPVLTPQGPTSGKRPSFSNSSLYETRNVKSCIRTISDRIR